MKWDGKHDQLDDGHDPPWLVVWVFVMYLDCYNSKLHSASCRYRLPLVAVHEIVESC
jgi:hypothetical protein